MERKKPITQILTPYKFPDFVSWSILGQKISVQATFAKKVCQISTFLFDSFLPNWIYAHRLNWRNFSNTGSLGLATVKAAAVAAAGAGGF